MISDKFVDCCVALFCKCLLVDHHLEVDEGNLLAIVNFGKTDGLNISPSTEQKDHFKLETSAFPSSPWQLFYP